MSAAAHCTAAASLTPVNDRHADVTQHVVCGPRPDDVLQEKPYGTAAGPALCLLRHRDPSCKTKAPPLLLSCSACALLHSTALILCAAVCLRPRRVTRTALMPPCWHHVCTVVHSTRGQLLVVCCCWSNGGLQGTVAQVAMGTTAQQYSPPAPPRSAPLCPAR